jgi:hypothetical protein
LEKSLLTLETATSVMRKLAVALSNAVRLPEDSANVMERS